MWPSCFSTYCTHIASCDIYALCMSILEFTARPVEFLQWLHNQQLIVRCWNNAFCVFPYLYCDMHFVYGFCSGIKCAAVGEYWRHLPEWRILSKGVFSCVHQTICETDCLPSVCVQSEMEVVPDINIWENILEMVQRSPKLSTLRIASHFGVLHMQVWQILHEKDLHFYHN